MRDFSDIKSLVGSDVTEEDLKHIDCYIHHPLGIFIPSTGACGYAAKKNHTHPAYMIAIFFTEENLKYEAVIVSPDVPHNDIDDFTSYYSIMIEKEYFEEQYRLYRDQLPYYQWVKFTLGRESLQMLNTFILECSKNIRNAAITLDAQNIVITHWLIRNLLGEVADIRLSSSNYAVARAQHYIDRHFGSCITVNQLAALGNMSASTFNRLFKKEVGLTPIKYLIEIRIDKSKSLLRGSELSITEVATKCGFGSSAHFSSEFKRLTNVTPSEYRDAYIH